MEILLLGLVLKCGKVHLKWQKKSLYWLGIQGATEKRKRDTEEKIATGNIGQFTHAHNQYLDDLSKRGIVGLFALLAVLLIPLRAFMKKLNTTNDEVKLIATLGVAHILSVMIYGLSQGFLVHNSGTIFYFFLNDCVLCCNTNTSEGRINENFSHS